MFFEFVGHNLHVFVTIFLISFILYAIYIVLSGTKWYSDLPPGPPSYPIIGNVLDLRGKDMGTYFEQCREKYGDIFSLRLFHKLVIVFNRQEVLKDVFVNNGLLFSERPKLSFAKDEGIVFASGQEWKTNRRFGLQTLRDFGMGRNTLQVKIHEEIEAILNEIERHDGKPFDIGTLLNCAVANIVCSIIFSKRFSYDDAKLRKHVEHLNIVTSSTSMFFGSSIFQYIPGDLLGIKAYQKVLDKIENFYNEFIEKHLAEYDENCIKDVIDVYIKQMKVNPSDKSSIEANKYRLRTIVSDLVGAGSETTATSLKWGIVYLLNHPELQNRLHNELQNNVSRDNLPNVRDKLKLPLVEATTMEILRLGNIVPFGVPHAAIRDCSFRGFNIPKNALLLPNLQSCLYDSKIWGDPLKFRPERFIKEEGSIKQKDDMMPFSLGRRSCLGESLARMELFLFFSAMVQNFEFLPPEGEDPPTMQPTYGVVRAPKPFVMRAIRRKR